METAVKNIHKLLINKGKTVSVAESCSGGLVSSLLTEEPGSSAYFIAGIIPYSNQAKESLLKIPKSIIKKNGAVSEKVARLMASRARMIFKTDFGIGVTGIAGPAGATPTKPVGTVFIAVAGKNKLTCRKFNFTGNRDSIRKKTAQSAMVLLRSRLK
ncbi:MAG: CinA family protein [Candidatus Omnitrophota bacterium]